MENEKMKKIQQPSPESIKPSQPLPAQLFEPQSRMRFENLRTYFFLLVLIIISIAFFKILQPFLKSIVLAATFSGLSYPLYSRILRLTKGAETISAFITLLLIFLLFLIPLTLTLIAVYNEAVDFSKSVDLSTPTLKTYMNHLLVGLSKLDFLNTIDFEKLDWQSKVADLAKTLSSSLAGLIKRTSQNVFQALFTIFVMIFTMFFFYIDGEKLLKKLKAYSPIRDDYQDLLFSQFVSTTRATLKGSLVIGFVQGTLGGITFAICGVKSPIFWGLVMMIFSVIPMVGANPIWIPAGLLKLLSGQYWQGIVILGVGVAIITTLDNILRPKLVGKDTALHPLIIFFSTLGGLLLFGVIGFIIGPIIASLFTTIWQIWSIEFKEELKPAGSDEQKNSFL